MNIALSFLAAVALSPSPARENGAPSPVLDANVLERIYKVGDEATYVLAFTSDGGMHIGAKVHTKTLSLLDGGKASQELTASDFEGGPDGAAAPEKVTWTFGKDGMPLANFSVDSGAVVYSLLGMLSFVPGEVTPGKEFKIAWTSPDKDSTMVGTGTYEGTKDVKGVQLAVIKSTFDVTPAHQQKGSVHNTAYFEPKTGKLVSADGTVEVGTEGMQMKFSITSN